MTDIGSYTYGVATTSFTTGTLAKRAFPKCTYISPRDGDTRHDRDETRCDSRDMSKRRTPDELPKPIYWSRLSLSEVGVPLLKSHQEAKPRQEGFPFIPTAFVTSPPEPERVVLRFVVPRLLA